MQRPDPRRPGAPAGRRRSRRRRSRTYASAGRSTSWPGWSSAAGSTTRSSASAATPSRRRTYGLAWRIVAVDAVFVLLPEAHPLAERRRGRPRGAGRRAVGGRARRRVLRRLLRGGVRAGRVHPAQDVRDRRRAAASTWSRPARRWRCARPRSGRSTGLVTRPLAGAPLRWRQLLGWHPDTLAAAVRRRCLRHAVAAYVESLRRNTRYLAWLRDHPTFGAQRHHDMSQVIYTNVNTLPH